MNLRGLRICVQKFHSDQDTHNTIHKQLKTGGGVVQAIFMKNLLWNPGDTITISFLPFEQIDAPEWYPLSQVRPSLTSAQMDIEIRARAEPTLVDAVKLIVNEMVQPAVPKLNLKFVDNYGDVRVRFQKNGGSSSLIGTSCKTAPNTEFTLTFGWMDVGTIIHEFSHALGMLHEHQNPAGGIQWNTEAVYTWAEQTQGWDKETTDINILDAYPSNEISGSNFDPKSVMLYFFPPELTLNNLQVGQNLRYSQTDLMWLASQYQSPYNPNLYTPTVAPLVSPTTSTPLVVSPTTSTPSQPTSTPVITPTETSTSPTTTPVVVTPITTTVSPPATSFSAASNKIQGWKLALIVIASFLGVISVIFIIFHLTRK